MLRIPVQQAKALLREASHVQVQQSRTTVVLRRMYPMRECKVGQKRRIRGIKEQVYILEDDRAHRPAGDMDVLLTRDVEGVGRSGSVVTTSKRLARNRLLPFGIAVYPSEENLDKYTKSQIEPGQIVSDLTKKCLRQLESMTLPIPMNPDVNWVLTPKHVILALRKLGVMAPQHAITLPQEPITEPQNFKFNLKVNGKHDVKVSAQLYHFIHGDPDPPKMNVWSTSKITLSQALGDLHIKS